MAAGFKGYGTKPIQIREFADEVRTILDRCVGTSAGGA
jgi:DNA-binding response OmpR family regulator